MEKGSSEKKSKLPLKLANRLKKRHKQQVDMLKIKPRSDFVKATASFAGALLLLIIWALFKGYVSLFILLAAGCNWFSIMQ